MQAIELPTFETRREPLLNGIVCTAGMVEPKPVSQPRWYSLRLVRKVESSFVLQLQKGFIYAGRSSAA
jgi:hypothetical protein